MKKFIFILTVLFTPLAFAQKIVGVGVVWPPFFIQDKTNKGVAVEIVETALKQQGIEMEMKYLPWARAVDGVKDGKFEALVGVWKTKEREKFLLFSEHYLENSIKFIKKKGDNFEYNGLESLKGKKVGIVRDYGYGDKFLKSDLFSRPIASGIMKNVKKLISGRIDLTLGDEIVTRSLIANQEDTTIIDNIEFTQNSLSINKLYFGTGLKHPNHKQLIDQFNAGFKAIKSDGTLQKILEKYKLK
ncbi:substrate-binding periplasmic protein [Algicola sagamiensis]|uniref:substrate-binding periplasmic protein n=1 Tax=Algicola sagamiensis TaxID=163869 RepID=UPI00039D49BA|nr:transporter substrate-binding domain-containing protein [Algicola sagamiensis]